MVAPSRSWGDKIGATGGNSTRSSTASGQKNNFAGYRGPVGTSNPDTSSAGVSQAPRNTFPGGGSDTSTGQTTSYGAPISVNKYGIKTALPEVATPGRPAQSWGSWKDQVDKYNQAARQWNAGAGRSLANFANKVAPFGLSMEAPDLNRPATYTGGTYHMGWNPGSLAGLATGAVIPGSGLITGPLGQEVYTAMGGKNQILTGPDVPAGWDPNGGAPAFSGQQQSTPSIPGRTESASTAPGGAPFGAQPTSPQAVQTAATPSTPTMFAPKLPNHSLPYGYQSAFPNSLTDEDKRLLYAQYLMGAA